MIEVKYTQFNLSPEAVARFWSKVNIPSDRGHAKDCWEWTAGKTGDGYGQFGVDRVMTGAHKIAYALINGDIPDDMLVLHNCNNRSCVNPYHLYAGTVQDNIQDRIERYENGELIPQGFTQKITDDELSEMLRKYDPKKRNGKKLAKKYGISHSYLYRLAAGRPRG